MACSKILQVLSGVSATSEVRPFRALGQGRRSIEDWKSTATGKSYTSIASSVPGLAKWVRAHAADDMEWIDESIHWLRLARAHPGPDDEWTDWQLALMLRMRGDHEGAATALAAVLKAKRNEFWAWAEAGRLYASDQPELARACFCRALTCPATDGFKINVRRSRGGARRTWRLSTNRGNPDCDRDRAEAGKSAGAAGSHRQPVVRPGNPGAEASGVLRPLRGRRLVLCFDNVKTGPGTTLGPSFPRPRILRGVEAAPAPRFAVRMGRTDLPSRRPGMKIQNRPAPVTITIGLQDDGREQSRRWSPGGGDFWDCLDAQGGILLSAARMERPVFIDRTAHQAAGLRGWFAKRWRPATPSSPGCDNPKRGGSTSPWRNRENWSSIRHPAILRGCSETRDSRSWMTSSCPHAGQALPQRRKV